MAKKRSRSSKKRAVRKSIASVSVSKNNKSTCCSCANAKSLGWAFLIFGVLYLLHDLGAFAWWRVSWFTILFIICGYWLIKQ